MSQDERIREFMKRMSEVTAKTGITYAVEAGRNLFVYDVKNNEPVELEIVVGTEIKTEDGRTSITTFDRSNITDGCRTD